MNSRERVLLTINHKEPDRVPIGPPLGRVNLDDAAKRFIETFDFDSFVSLDFRKNIEERHKLSDDVYVDDYGCVYKHKGVSEIPYCIHSPLWNARKVDEVEKYPKWPNPDDSSLIQKDAYEKAKKLYEETNHVTVVSVPTIFHRYAYVRGFNRWLMDMKTNPELYEAIASKIQSISLKSTLRLLKETGDHVDLVMLNDDMGSTRGPFMSVEDFRRFVKPYYKELMGRIKKDYPKIRFWLHSHGCITNLVPDIIDCGVDVLNPVLPGDNVDPQVLKKEFGSQLCFDGGVDVEYMMPFGTVEQVREHAKKVIDTLSSGGGYIFRVQMISNIVPYENLYTAYKTALVYGNY